MTPSGIIQRQPKLIQKWLRISDETKDLDDLTIVLLHIPSVSLMIHGCSPYIIITPSWTWGFTTICLPNIILKQLLSIKLIHCHQVRISIRYLRLPHWVYIAQLKEKQFDLFAVLSRKDVCLFTILSSSLPPLSVLTVPGSLRWRANRLSWNLINWCFGEKLKPAWNLQLTLDHHPPLLWYEYMMYFYI